MAEHYVKNATKKQKPMLTINTNKISPEISKKYKVVNNAFRQVVKSDSKDLLTIEVGDTKQPTEFFPQIKICRWGDNEETNEVNFSCRLIDDEPKQLTTEGEKIKLVGATKEVHFYEDGENYEFEVILREKPTSNKLEFSIETKGLDFFYQPPLTEEEKKTCIRPENVVGSYAVYHNGNPINYEGGKLYKAGKAFHVYRPKIIDSAGSWVWGELNIDQQKGLLTVTIPQEFLDKAVYPIKHAAGLEFGYHTKGGTETSGISTYGPYRSIYTMGGADGTGSSLSCYWYSTSGSTKNAHYALYSGNNIVSNGLTGEGDIISQFNDWLTINFTSPPSLTASTNYGLAFHNNGATAIAGYFDEGSGVHGYDTTSYGAFPDPWSNNGSGTRTYSIYCTYTAAGVTRTDQMFQVF